MTGTSWGALLAWIVLLTSLHIVGLPLAKAVFRRFPDQGWGFARLLALLVAAYGVWLIASVRLVAFLHPAVVLTSLLGTFCAGLIIIHALHGSHRVPLPDEGKKQAAATEIAFWTVFGLFLSFCLANPDSYHPIWGGGKPMEFAHINAILRAEYFPPEDPWYAGGLLNYYYYGEYLAAFLIKATGIPTDIAFNLIQPTVMGVLASGMFSLSLALSQFLWRGARPSSPVAIGFGVLVVVLVVLSGNLVAAARLVDGALNGFPRADAFGYWVWAPTRAVPSPQTQHGITEFPYFSGLFGDLHAHVIALPITVTVVAVCLAVVSDTRSPSASNQPPVRSLPRGERALHIALSALLLGTLWITNAWDVPLYAALVTVTLVMSTRGGPSLVKRAATTLGLLVFTLGLAYASVLPFQRHYQAIFSEVGFKDANSPLVSIASHFGIFLVVVLLGMWHIMARDATLPPVIAKPYVVVGLVLVALVFRWWAASQTENLTLAADVMLVAVVTGFLFAGLWSMPFQGGTWIPPGRLRLTMALGVPLVAVPLLADRPSLALFLGLGWVALWLWVMLPNVIETFTSLLVAMACLLVAGLELVYVKDDLWSLPWYRMNSVFKFYNQAWILLGLASLAMLVMIVGTFRGSQAATMGIRQQSALAWGSVSLVVTMLLIPLALSYPLLATTIRLDQRFPQEPSGGLTLSAYDWMNDGAIATGADTRITYAEDRAVIAWFNDEVEGSPVILEASFGPYRCNGSRISIATGLPSVIGWRRHEEQQRVANDLVLREKQVPDFYTSGDVDSMRRTLAQYDVAYVIVGETERQFPSIRGNDCIPTDTSASMDAMSGLVGTDLEIAFQSGSTVVYRVVSTGLDEGPL